MEGATRDQVLEHKVREETVIVLDFLPHGYPHDTRPSHRKTAIVQAIGTKHFVLLELVPKKDIFLQPLQEAYIGEGKRDQIHHISGKLSIDKLTVTAKNELDFVIKDLVQKNENFFVNFFNTAKPLTTRMHQLELVPGFGKKHMWDVLEKRDEKKFESFKDLRERVKLIPDPEKAIVKRILKELSGDEKHKIFVDM
ncbi:DNA-binding protein [Candidatus Woesearchaeota archaeon CG10_big_fil_rev_8_21_14_0_10_37_12]|nr:MAG: DNA-binding protein [Candidatus Woesearchaeota archaeon CG10_big_fil_rev_8_21_14_0_10_37_12]